MQRFRAALLALGLVALLAGMALGVLATRRWTSGTTTWAWPGASRVTAVDDYADRARAVTLLASHSAAFANFYQAPGSRMSRIEGRRPARPDLMPRVITALTDLGEPVPRQHRLGQLHRPVSGQRTRGVVGKSVMRPDELVADRSDAVVLRPRLPAALRQGLPVGALPLGVDGRLGRRQRRQGQHRARCLARDRELRGDPVESVRLAAYSDNPAQQVRVVDLLDGRVDHRLEAPAGRQRAAGPAGRPQSLRWVQTARDGVLRTPTGSATSSSTPGPRQQRRHLLGGRRLGRRLHRRMGGADQPRAPVVACSEAAACSSPLGRRLRPAGPARCTVPPGATSSPCCTTGWPPARSPTPCWCASAAWR